MLPKNKRISRKDFQSLGKPVQILRGSFFTAKIYKTLKDRAKFSVTVPKKIVKTAVFRNKIRRETYKFIRNDVKFKPGLSIQLILYKNPKELKQEISEDLFTINQKIN